MQKFDQPPNEREYLHDRCRETTHVSGNDFHALCDPRFAADKTFCGHCQQFDKLNAFRWSDTNELLSDYRTRLRDLVPFYVHIAGSKWLFLVWIILATLTGCLLSQCIASFKIAYGVPAVVFFIIAMACDGVGKLSTQHITFHQYR
jgi:hypothetical protein